MVKNARFLKFIKGLWPLATFPKKSKTIARILSVLNNSKITNRILNSRLAVSLPEIPSIFTDFLPPFLKGVASLPHFLQGASVSSQTNDMIVYYLPNNEVITINETIEKPPDTVLPTQILDNIIDKAEHFYLLNVCFCRFFNNCKDYPTDVGCLFVGESVLSIAPTHLGRLVSRDEARAHVKKARDRGLVHMIGKTFPESYFLEVDDDKLLTVCNCCPCCCTISLFEYFPKEIGKLCRKLPGVTVKVDKDKCVGCKTCTKDVCFVNAIHVIKGKAIIDQDYCKACGRCIVACPKKAINISINDDKYSKKAMREIERRLQLWPPEATNSSNDIRSATS